MKCGGWEERRGQRGLFYSYAHKPTVLWRGIFLVIMKAMMVMVMVVVMMVMG